jgi:transcriptional regulator with XRE-family HTH domain
VPRYDPKKVAKSVGRRIAELRRDGKITQAALAELLSVTPQWVSQIEMGRANMTLDTLCRLANALDTRLEDLLQTPRPESRRVKKGRPLSRTTAPLPETAGR